MRRPFVACAVVFVAACLMAAVSSASTATMLSVSPSAPLVGDSLVFSGCGYTPGISLVVQAVRDTKASTWIFQDSLTADSSGCFSTSANPYVAPDAGKWTATVWESGYEDAKLVFNVKSPH